MSPLTPTMENYNAKHHSAGIKLDFKSLASVGLSLDLLREKNSSGGINQPVWLNADILQGPNVPDFILPVNGTR